MSDGGVREDGASQYQGCVVYRNAIHSILVIISFKCKETAAIFDNKKLDATRKSKAFRQIQRVAERKLQQLDDATGLGDLKVPYSNHLEALKHERRGQYSIRINSQWRICFVWTDRGPADVEIVDYH